LFLNLRIPGKSIFGLYIRAGIDMSLPLKSNYNSTGIFSFTGYYPAYNVLLKDLPEYGFVNDASVSGKGEYELRKYFFEAVAGAGFQFLIANKIQLSAGVSYARSLTDIADYTKPYDFLLLSDNEGINSMLGGSYRSMIESFGLNLSVRYFFRGYRVRSVQPQVQ
jgi:hypothetical protein